MYSKFPLKIILMCLVILTLSSLTTFSNAERGGSQDTMAGQVPIKDTLVEIGKNDSFTLLDWTKGFKAKKRNRSRPNRRRPKAPVKEPKEKESVSYSESESGSFEEPPPRPQRDACSQPIIRGKCYDKITRWHYNWRRDACRHFTYSGCGGNGNNFISQRNCEDYCRGGISGDGGPGRY